MTNFSEIDNPHRGSYLIGPFKVGTEYPVTEVFYNDEDNEFWVTAADRDLSSFTQKLQDAIQELKPLTGPIYKGVGLVAQFSEDNDWYREGSQITYTSYSIVKRPT